jgi:hypothetical protein
VTAAIVARTERKTLRWSLTAVGVVVCILVCLELGARVAASKISRIESREIQEYSALFSPARSGKIITFFGNSLLRAAIDFPKFQRTVAPDIDARRYIIEDTSYYDWYYGIKRIFERGARPSVVTLMMTELQFTNDHIRGDYSALRLWQTKDIPEIAARTHLHPTNATGLMLASMSTFYGLRGEIRKIVLGRLMPDLPVLTGKLTFGRAKDIPDDEFFPKAAARLREIRELCNRNGARFVVIIPALPDYDSDRMVKVANAEGVLYLRPFSHGQFTNAEFEDGFHLNEKGQALYTRQLANEVRTRLPELVH